MNNENITYWIKGYLEAIQDGSNVSKKHVQNLINKLQEFIEQIDDDDEIDGPPTLEKPFSLDEADDDLPF